MTGTDPLGTEVRLLAVLGALASHVRLNVLSHLQGGPRHVSRLARDLGVGRPLLHMHLDKLEAAGLVRSQLELSEAGKALRVYTLVDFALTITPDVITAALAHPALAHPAMGDADPTTTAGDPT